MSQHAVLSASSASRWIACAGSVRMIAPLPHRLTNRTSVYADEGSCAHSVGEQCLRDGKFVPEDFRGQMIQGELKEWECNEDMVAAVTVYVDYIRRRQRELGADLFVEAKVRPLPEFDDMYGTADAVLVEPWGLLEVTDYKHGAGVFVSSEDNDQMKFYALGALLKVGPLNVSRVRLTIVQPRCEGMDPVRSWECSVDELLDYGDVLRAARLATQEPDAPLSAGDHCRWCPVPKCPELERIKNLAVVDDFAVQIAEHAADGKLVSPEIVATLPDPDDPDQLYLGLMIAPVLEHFVKRVREMAVINLELLVPVRGHKLVRKRANRAWVDPEEVEQKLRNRKGVRVGDFTKSTLKSPAQMEKVAAIGKDFVAEYCEKPQGGLTLARADDPRPAASLLDEFAGYIDVTQD